MADQHVDLQHYLAARSALDERTAGIVLLGAGAAFGVTAVIRYTVGRRGREHANPTHAQAASF